MKTTKSAYHSPISENIDKHLIMLAKLTGGQIPYGTLAEIARMNHVSREYVRQKVTRLNLIPYKVIKEEIYCITCGNEIKKAHYNSKYCSNKCYKEFFRKRYYTATNCKICNKEILYLKSSVRIPVYCSNKCQGKDFGIKSAITRNAKYPTSKAGFIRNLGKEFTVIDFAKRYAIRYSYAISRIMDYRIKGLIIKTDRKKGYASIYKVL